MCRLECPRTERKADFSLRPTQQKVGVISQRTVCLQRSRQGGGRQEVVRNLFGKRRYERDLIFTPLVAKTTCVLNLATVMVRS
jgi:hypothetical protein